MGQESIKTIKIAGLDYSNRLRRLFGKSILNLAHDGDLYYPLKKKKSEDNGEVIIDLSLLYADTQKDREDLGRMGCGRKGGFLTMGGSMTVFSIKEKIQVVADRFREADVLFISGHHYGSDYYKDESHNYYSPGLTSRLHFSPTTPKTKFEFAPAFDLNSLYLWGGPFPNVKLIVFICCNSLRENILPLYQDLFPNAVVLGYHAQAPLGTSDDRLLRKFLRALPWTMKDGFRGLLSPDASDKDIKHMLIAAWIKAIYASNTRWSQPGYYREINGIWLGDYINMSLPKVRGAYQFARLDDPTFSRSQAARVYVPQGDIESYVVDLYQRFSENSQKTSVNNP